MILSALCDYYTAHQDKLPPFGKELKAIGFIIVIDKNGRFLRFEDRRSSDKKSADEFLVKKSVGRSSAPLANCLYDNAAYVLGYDDKKDCKKYITTFQNKLNQLASKACNHPDLTSVLNFYDNFEHNFALISNDPLWKEIVKNLNKKYSNFTFRIDGDMQVVAEKSELIDLDESGEDDAEERKICLISGQPSAIVETTTATMIPGSQVVAKLVAFQVNSGYDSYGKKKGGNAPIGVESEFSYTTALNYMLRSGSRNKFLIGNRTFLYWSSKRDEACMEMENSLYSLFGIEGDENASENTESLRKVLTSIYTGEIPSTSEDRFFILGLSPNSARIAVSFWAEIPLRQFAGNILRHFEDFAIIDSRINKKPYQGVRTILSNVTLGGKSSDAIPNLPESIVKSIFQALPYPYSLFSACIRRIRAEQKIYTGRAAILKAYLNRIDSNHKNINEMLDTANLNPAYLCGRLFAVIEKIQGDANGIATVKERYLNGASATPSAIFPTLLNLSVHHQQKLSASKVIFFEKLKQEIIDKLPSKGFPVHLSLDEQGKFFVGYYHQMQNFFQRREEKDNN